MSLVIIFGPPAAGKATVGRVLAEQTGYKLLHNHMTVDLVGGIFDFGTDAFRTLVVEFRQRVVEETARAGVGLILTMAWSLDDDGDAALVADYDEAAAAFGRAVYWWSWRPRSRCARNVIVCPTGWPTSGSCPTTTCSSRSTHNTASTRRRASSRRATTF